MVVDIKAENEWNVIRRTCTKCVLTKIIDVQHNPNPGSGPKLVFTFRSFIDGHYWTFSRPIRANYKKDTVLTLYYNPEEPSANVLEKERIPWYTPWFFFAGAFIAAVGGIILLLYLGRFIETVSIPMYAYI